MKYIEARVIISSGSPDPAEELIVSILDDLGLKGAIIENPADGLQTLAGKTGTLPPEHTVTGFFPADASGKKRCLQMESALADLKTRGAIHTRIVYRNIDEEDWAESWKAFFHPEKITSRLVVKPTWRKYSPGPDETVIEIDPGMAFGTGTHPTTTLCARMLEENLCPGQRILDVGTGSGILSIIAARLGAASGVGIDNDLQAVRIARSNLHLNHLDPNRFRVVTGNLVAPLSGRFDLVVANILTDVILSLITSLDRVLTPGGLFICSGIIRRDIQKIADSLRRHRLDVIDQQVLEEWAAFTARSRENGTIS